MPSVIESFDNTGDVFVQRIPAQGSAEWDLGSQLVVQENQIGIFWRDGRSLDAFRPGRHTIETANVPLMGQAIGSGFGGKSPFRACVYFVSTKVYPGLGWGTPQPVNFRDSEFGMVPVRAFGSYSIRITKPKLFMASIVGTQGRLETGDIQDLLRSFIVSRFNTILGETLKNILDLTAMYDDLALRLKAAVRDEFEQYGITLVDLLIEAVTPPAEVQAMINKAAGIAIQDVDRYQKIAAADAMVEGAKNPAGGASAGIGAGLGAGLGMAMGAQMQGAAQEPQSGAGGSDLKSRLKEIKSVFDDGLIDEDEYKAAKAAILKELSGNG
ncbi:MAG: SPFH domain-containing protein [Phycisphaerales bacterium]|nr:SPFH domain-containing protein [Phycisphaerales bacterium]